MSERAFEILKLLAERGATPTGLSADSRVIGAGDVFAAYPGFRTDGRNYLLAAAQKGAVAVLWDPAGGFDAPALPVVALPVEDLRKVAGELAHEIYGRPSERLWLAGVTGTNGKTTVSQWLARSLSELGVRCGLIGTLGCGFPGQLDPSLNTTPDAPTLHRMLADFLAEEAQACAMEVSSIGLHQGRVNGAQFDLAIFTNLSRDHLDYHGDMEHYAACKAQLFEMPGLGGAVVNLDDSFGVGLARRLALQGTPVIGYTRSPCNHDAAEGARVLMAERIQHTSSGLRCSLVWGEERAEISLRMVAEFNISNLLAVVGALLARGAVLEDVARVATRLTPPAGRMQILGGVGEPMVVVDYAHTPDALAKVLEAVRHTASNRGGRLLCVFGCGGDRDPGKRPLMGEVVRDLADRIIITSDNPRSEDPHAIIAAIAAAAGPDALSIEDRAAAIRRAVVEAGPDDVVVVAGKGHEPYQEVAGIRLPFSDLEQAREALLRWSEAQEDQT